MRKRLKVLFVQFLAWPRLQSSCLRMSLPCYLTDDLFQNNDNNHCYKKEQTWTSKGNINPNYILKNWQKGQSITSLLYLLSRMKPVKEHLLINVKHVEKLDIECKNRKNRSKTYMEAVNWLLIRISRLNRKVFGICTSKKNYSTQRL